MYILGIETSCDETAAAVVQDGRYALSNTVVSSLKEHSKFGGIIPEIASRRQMEYITAVIDKSLTQAGLTPAQLDAIAVTTTPGLIGSLLVGTSFARAISYALKKPLIEVNHIEAHLYANFLTFQKGAFSPPQLPAIGLVVSGGHSSLYHLADFKKFKLIGHTIDDAAGEAFDKVARVLGLGYPGGPVIDKLASNCKKANIQFTCAALPDTLDFSFSGVKTAVLYHHRDHHKAPDYDVQEVAKAFQDSVVSVLVKKSIAACRQHKCRTLLVGGGVAANSKLRADLQQEAQQNGISVYFPPMALCLDNAAMIAGLAYHQTQKPKRKAKRHA